ncbi:MAG TPA: ribosome biogenesis GTPase Der [Acidobacteriota bacterium]|jgi:GTP-binding protein|nr:ribosome biogenesis GTPase Der [Acidobacteriota bacterium]
MYQVAILGRPNVGKSTLFNRLIRSRRSIVGDQPGITRDRIYGLVEKNGKKFAVVDTGGMIPRESELIASEMFKQATVALQESNLLLLMVDAQTGPTPLDEELLQYLRKTGKELWLVVNKVDVPGHEDRVAPFYQLGTKRIFPVSAEHKIGIEDLVTEIAQRVEESTEAAWQEETRIAIVGRPNVGKSSIVNFLCGQQRVIVGEAPGTTRDSVDTLIRREGRSFRLVDTAGIRRKGKTEAMAEKLSVVMARKSLSQADVAVVVIDGVEGPTKLDAAIAGYALDEGCSILVGVNKWDLVINRAQAVLEFQQEISRRMKFLDFAPVDFISARTGQRVVKILDHAARAAQARQLRISTSELNEFFHKKIKQSYLDSFPDRKFKVKYITQVSTAPPTFVLFANSPKIHFSHRRFVINRLREQFDFYATPIRLLVRSSGQKTRHS